MKIGIKTWRFGLTNPLSECIRRSADLGYEFIDINFHLIRHEREIYYWPKEMAPTHRHEIKKLLKDYHLEAGIVIPKVPQVTRANLEPVKIDDIAELSDIPEEEALSLSFRVKEGIKAIRDINAQLLDDIHLPSCDQWGDLDQLMSTLKSTDLHDIRIGLENREDTDPKLLLETFKELKIKNVGLTYDVGHAYTYMKNSENVVEQIHELSRFICHVHIHEKSKDGISPIFGRGDINWIKIIQAFKSIGYSGSLTLEMNPENNYILSIPPHPDFEILKYKWIMEYLLKDS